MKGHLDHETISCAKARIAEMNDQIARGRTFLVDTDDTRSEPLQAMRASTQRRIKFYEDEIAYWTKSLPHDVHKHPIAHRARKLLSPSK